MQSVSDLPLCRRRRYPTNGPRSHGACIQCKKSHVKCDERKPACGRCVRIGLSCECKEFIKKADRGSVHDRYSRVILPVGPSIDSWPTHQAMVSDEVRFGDFPAHQALTMYSHGAISPDDYSKRGRRRMSCDESLRECHDYSNERRYYEDDSVYLPSTECTIMQKQHQFRPLNKTPWIVYQVKSYDYFSIPTTLEPADCFATEMPFKSKELFRYFSQTNSMQEAVAKLGNDCLQSVIIHPSSLTCTMLIAGIHFSWCMDGLDTFQHAFLFHKLQTIRRVNKWINNQESRSIFYVIQEIATLCLSEICLGDSPSAETHLCGIVAILNNLKPFTNSITEHDRLEYEVAMRYFVLIQFFLSGFKCCSRDIMYRSGYSSDDFDTLSTEKIAKSVNSWLRLEDKVGIERKLLAFQLLPTFLYSPSNTSSFSRVNGQHIADCLRSITANIDEVLSDIAMNGKTFERFWANGNASRNLESWVLAHVLSISSPDHQSQTVYDEDFTAKWCPLFIAAGTYLTYVLRVWETMEKPIHRYTINLFGREIKDYVTGLELATPFFQSFVFWQLYLGAIYGYSYPLQDGDNETRLTLIFIHSSLKRLARSMGLRCWEDTRNALMRIAWPAANADNSIVRAVWDRLSID